MKQTKNKRAIFAALAVLVMMLVPFSSVIQTGESEAVAPLTPAAIPTGSNYAYKLIYNENNTQVQQVLVKSGSSFTEATSIIELGDQSKDDTKFNRSIDSDSTWKFTSGGVGPFNTFYAAVNLITYSSTSSDENYNPDYAKVTPLNKNAGEIAYVLDPSDLTKTLPTSGTNPDTGTVLDTSLYNIMLVIPTVYWYSDEVSRVLYMSNSSTAFTGYSYEAMTAASTADTVVTYTVNTSTTYVLTKGDLRLEGTASALAAEDWVSLDSTTLTVTKTSSDTVVLSKPSSTKISSQMVAPAHTYVTDLFTHTTPAKYLMLGVYEGHSTGTAGDGTAKLVSQPKVTVASGGSFNINEFRNEAKRNSVIEYDDGSSNVTYGLWNYYQWTLYKMMGYTILGNKDAQWMMGLGITGSKIGGNDDHAEMSKKNSSYSSAGSYVGHGAYHLGASTVYSDSSLASDPVCLLLENSWGNVWECVDDAFMDYKILFTGQNLDVTSTTGGTSTTGKVYVSTGVSRAPITATYSNTMQWDLPSATQTTAPATWTQAEHMNGTTVGDTVWFGTSTTTDYSIWVGGSSNDGVRGGLASVRAGSDLSDASDGCGARLACLSTGVSTVAVTYNVNGSGGSTPTADTGRVGGTITLEGAQTYADHKFVSWNTKADGTGLNYAAESAYQLSGNVTLYAIWLSTGYVVTLTFKSSDSSSFFANLDGGSSIQLPPADTVTGKVFSGWYTSDGVLIGQEGQYFTPTASQTLYAKYSDPVGYDVTDTLSAADKTFLTLAYTERIGEGGTGVVVITILEPCTYTGLSDSNNNCNLVKLSDTSYMISDVTGNVSLTMGTVAAMAKVGPKDFYIAGLLDGNNDARVVLTAGNDAGLWNGEITIGGVFRATVGEITGYGSIAQLSPSKFTVTGSPTTVQKDFSLPNYQDTIPTVIQYVYAQYAYDTSGGTTYDDGSVVTLGVWAPATDTTL